MKKYFLNHKPYIKKTDHELGLTIIELIVVVAVLGIIVAIVSPQFAKIKENQVINNGVQEVLSAINKARSQTLSSLNSSEYGVHFQSDKVIIFKGTVFSAMAGDNEEIVIIPPASITDVTIGVTSGSSGDIYFKRLSASPSDTASITLSTSSYTKVITIYATGVASVN